MQGRPHVSVVVITRNRPECLADCLDAVIGQTGPTFETIVVDASDDEATHRLIARYPAVVYRYLADGAGKMPVSRNLGIAAARGEVVAFLDDDSRPLPGWLERLAELHADAQVGAVGGPVLHPGEEISGFRYDSPLPLMTTNGLPDYGFRRLVDRPTWVDHLMGCNMSFRAGALARIGGFDPAYDGTNAFEETDVCLRVKRVGYTILYDTRVAVRHLAAPRDGYDRSRLDPVYRFSALKNRTYFTLRHYPLLSRPFLSLLGTTLWAWRDGAASGQGRLRFVLLDLAAKLAGARTYLRKQRHGEPTQHFDAADLPLEER